MKSKSYAILMAGGSGTRLWPLSTQDRPKQYLNIINNKSFLNQAVERLKNSFNIDNIYIISNVNQKDILEHEVCKEFKLNNIIYEPIAKNTAACITYMLLKLRKKHGNVVVGVFPADHYINKVDKFNQNIDYAIDLAYNTRKIVLIGVNPFFPSTDYGYIKRGRKYKKDNYYNIISFTEKPDYDKAKKYLISGDYSWNSGMYVFLVDTLLEYIKQFIPDTYIKLSSCEKYFGTQFENEKMAEVYETLPEVSIDYAVMEKIKDSICIDADFGWNDVGSWKSLAKILPRDNNGNVIVKQNFDFKGEQAIVSGKKIVFEDVDNLLFIETENEIFIKRYQL